MIWVDFALTGVAGICLVTGLWRGFGGEAYAILNWIIAVFVGLNFDKEFVRFLPVINDNPAVRMAGAFVALLVITLAFGLVIGYLLGIIANGVRVSFFARLGGMMMAFVRSIIIIAVLVMLAGLTGMPKDSWWQESKLLPPFQLLAVGLRDHVPSGIAEYVNYR